MRPEGADCYVKMLINKADNNKVVGFHILSPNAGEVTQGIGIAMKCGATKEMVDSCIGIHPTIAEDCIGLETTKEENPDAKKSGCWGWVTAADYSRLSSVPRLWSIKVIITVSNDSFGVFLYQLQKNQYSYLP